MNVKEDLLDDDTASAALCENQSSSQRFLGRFHSIARLIKMTDTHASTSYCTLVPSKVLSKTSTSSCSSIHGGGVNVEGRSMHQVTTRGSSLHLSNNRTRSKLATLPVTPLPLARLGLFLFFRGRAILSVVTSAVTSAASSDGEVVAEVGEGCFKDHSNLSACVFTKPSTRKINCQSVTPRVYFAPPFISELC